MIKIPIIFVCISSIYVVSANNTINIDLSHFEGKESEIIHKNRDEILREQFLTLKFFGMDNDNLGFVVLQVHSLFNNTTLIVETDTEKETLLGTNLGYLIKKSHSPMSAKVFNQNSFEISVMIALIAYNNYSPAPGNCMLTADNSAAHTTIQIKEQSDFLLTATVPPAKFNDSCETGIEYETYYAYIDTLNFGLNSYFDSIEMMMHGRIYRSNRVKHPHSFVHDFEKIPGRGLVLNTVIRHNDQISYYVPKVTYSCPPNSWKSHCSDVSFLKRAISVLLVIHSIVMILNLLVPDLIEAILNGMLIGGFGTIIFINFYQISMQGFDFFITIIICAFFVSAIFGTLSLYISIGRCMSKFIYANFIMAFLMEFFFPNVTSPYLQFMLVIILLVIFVMINITFSVLLGALIFILNLSYLIKVGNIHRFIVNNYLSLTTIPYYSNNTLYDFARPNYINYVATLNALDFAFFCFYIIGSIFLTIRKERYFSEHPTLLSSDHIFSDDTNSYNCKVARQRRKQCIVGISRKGGKINYQIVSRYRHHHNFRSNVINERSPLISHWLTSDEGDDDVFESPESNSRFLQTLSAESRERLDAIQNFE